MRQSQSERVDQPPHWPFGSMPQPTSAVGVPPPSGGTLMESVAVVLWRPVRSPQTSANHSKARLQDESSVPAALAERGPASAVPASVSAAARVTAVSLGKIFLLIFILLRRDQRQWRAGSCPLSSPGHCKSLAWLSAPAQAA